MKHPHHNVTGLRASQMRKAFAEHPTASNSEIARLLDCNVKTVQAWRRTLNAQQVAPQAKLALRGEPRNEREEAYWTRRIAAGMAKYRAAKLEAEKPEPVEVSRYSITSMGSGLIRLEAK